MMWTFLVVNKIEQSKKFLDRAFFSNFEKRPLAEIGIDLASKLGEIKDLEHSKGSKIYPQNQVV